ncbi:MAG: hypothetical protein KKA73_03250 [Chloroflexi bacterium]|nr:hypothetical protein [Chloroflexota bacterium]MBU1746680.1 hypothetical protein [Chloroflexota bacterium]
MEPQGVQYGFGLLELVLLGGGGCLLLIVLLVGLTIIVKLFSTIRSLAGKVAMIGCYLAIIFGCCLLLFGGVLFRVMFGMN